MTRQEYKASWNQGFNTIDFDACNLKEAKSIVRETIELGGDVTLWRGGIPIVIRDYAGKWSGRLN